MKSENCSGTENRPGAFITRGRARPWDGLCRWLRVGRLRIGRYGGAPIRPSAVRYATGWQVTAAWFFVTWTYRAAWKQADQDVFYLVGLVRKAERQAHRKPLHLD